MWKKIAVWGGIAFLVFFVAFQPQAAANVVKSLVDVIVDVFQGFGDFISRVFS